MEPKKVVTIFCCNYDFGKTLTRALIGIDGCCIERTEKLLYYTKVVLLFTTDFGLYQVDFCFARPNMWQHCMTLMPGDRVDFVWSYICGGTAPVSFQFGGSCPDQNLVNNWSFKFAETTEDAKFFNYKRNPHRLAYGVNIVSSGAAPEVILTPSLAMRMIRNILRSETGAPLNIQSEVSNQSEKNIEVLAMVEKLRSAGMF